MKEPPNPFQEEESRHPWLKSLLESYRIVDEGVEQAIARRRRVEGRDLACRRGCDSCCRSQRDIPIYPHELTGIYWYCCDRIKHPTRGILRHQLTARTPQSACPFLMGGACIVHQVRPTGCRQFNVIGSVCAEGEDPFYTRRGDVVSPPRECTYEAFEKVLSLYGVEGENLKLKETVERIITTQVVNLQTYDWSKLARRMDEFDAAAAGAPGGGEDPEEAG